MPPKALIWLLDHETVRVQSSEGILSARIGKWIIRGTQGEYWVVKPDIFVATYERVGP